MSKKCQWLSLDEMIKLGKKIKKFGQWELTPDDNFSGELSYSVLLGRRNKGREYYVVVEDPLGTNLGNYNGRSPKLKAFYDEIANYIKNGELELTERQRLQLARKFLNS